MRYPIGIQTFEKIRTGGFDQIDSKDYTLPWTVDHRRVFKIGANFSTTER